MNGWSLTHFSLVTISSTNLTAWFTCGYIIWLMKMYKLWFETSVVSTFEDINWSCCKTIPDTVIHMFSSLTVTGVGFFVGIQLTCTFNCFYITITHMLQQVIQFHNSWQGDIFYLEIVNFTWWWPVWNMSQ